jgi:hypothetical protein
MVRDARREVLCKQQAGPVRVPDHLFAPFGNIESPKKPKRYPISSREPARSQRVQHLAREGKLRQVLESPPQSQQSQRLRSEGLSDIPIRATIQTNNGNQAVRYLFPVTI